MAKRIPDKIKKEIERKGGLDNIIDKIPSRKELKAMELLHHALSDGIRLKILFFLYYQESCVCLLKDVVNVTYSKLSYHLKILKKAGLIKQRKRGNYIIYSLSKKGKSIMDTCMIR